VIPHWERIKEPPAPATGQLLYSSNFPATIGAFVLHGLYSTDASGPQMALPRKTARGLQRQSGKNIMRLEHSTAFDPDSPSAWQDQLTKAVGEPTIERHLLQQAGELLARFAEYYKKVKVLPRRMRRALQRKWKQSLAGGHTPTGAGSGSCIGSNDSCGREMYAGKSHCLSE
jgi:hypothetical protein